MIYRFNWCPLCFKMVETIQHFSQVCMLSFLVLQDTFSGIWSHWIRIVLIQLSIDFLNHWRILDQYKVQFQCNHFNESHLETIFCLTINECFQCMGFTRKQVVVKQSLSLFFFSQLLKWFKSLRYFFIIINQSWWQVVFVQSTIVLLLIVSSLVCQSSCFFIR